MLPSFLEPREKEREGEREGGGSNTVRERSLKKSGIVTRNITDKCANLAYHEKCDS